MPRRRELKSIASGIASFCVSCDNDIFGCWGVRMICRSALAQQIKAVWIDSDSTLDDDPGLAAFRGVSLSDFKLLGMVNPRSFEVSRLSFASTRILGPKSVASVSE